MATFRPFAAFQPWIKDCPSSDPIPWNDSSGSGGTVNNSSIKTVSDMTKMYWMVNYIKIKITLTLPFLKDPPPEDPKSEKDKYEPITRDREFTIYVGGSRSTPASAFDVYPFMPHERVCGANLISDCESCPTGFGFAGDLIFFKIENEPALHFLLLDLPLPDFSDKDPVATEYWCIFPFLTSNSDKLNNNLSEDCNYLVNSISNSKLGFDLYVHSSFYTYMEDIGAKLDSVEITEVDLYDELG